MNQTEKVIIAGAGGTTAMTLFSYLVSLLANENFSEPEHLGTMINRLSPGHSKKYNYIAGWGVHYAIGLLFVLVYQELWKTGKIKKTVASAVILGALSGALAVLSWNLMLKTHPAPPWINFSRYYTQLVPAHIVFAVFSTITYRLLEEREATPGEVALLSHFNPRKRNNSQTL